MGGERERERERQRERKGRISPNFTSTFHKLRAEPALGKAACRAEPCRVEPCRAELCSWVSGFPRLFVWIWTAYRQRVSVVSPRVSAERVS